MLVTSDFKDRIFFNETGTRWCDFKEQERRHELKDKSRLIGHVSFLLGLRPLIIGYN